MSAGPREKFSMLDPRTQAEHDRRYAREMEEYFQASPGSGLDKLRHFAKFVPRQALSLFLAKAAIFERVLGVHGHIVECGVYLGGGLMTWAQLSAIHEPYNHVRRVVAFDTFTGFAAMHDKDKGDNLDCAVPGGLATGAEGDVRRCIGLYDLNRPIGHIPRAELVVGN